MDAYDAAVDISLADYDSWGDAERIVVNVTTLYQRVQRRHDAERHDEAVRNDGEAASREAVTQSS